MRKLVFGSLFVAAVAVFTIFEPFGRLGLLGFMERSGSEQLPTPQFSTGSTKVSEAAEVSAALPTISSNLQRSSDHERQPSSQLLAESAVVTATVKESALNPPVSTLASWAVAVVAISAMMLLLAFILLRRRRRILTTSPHLVTPIDFRKWTASLDQHVSAALVQSEHNNLRIDSLAASLSKDFSEMSRTFLTLQKALDERDREIARLREGTNSFVYKKFLRRFISIDRAANEIIDDSQSSLLLSDIRQLMRDALEECDVRVLTPTVGSDYRTTLGVGDHPDIVRTDDEVSHFKIVQILAPAYILERTDGKVEVIEPAKVSIYGPKEG